MRGSFLNLDVEFVDSRRKERENGGVGGFMSKIAIQTGLILVVFLLAPIAKAGLMFEPYVGYQTNGSVDTGTGTTYAYSGLDYGARVGFQATSFLVGAEYFAFPSMPSTPSPANPTMTFKVMGNAIGAFVGFAFPVLPLRFIATYFFQDNVTVTATTGSSSTDTLETGSGYKVGVYYKLFHMLSLGGEYVNSTYTQATTGGVSGTLTPSVKNSSVNVVIGLPFNL